MPDTALAMSSCFHPWSCYEWGLMNVTRVLGCRKNVGWQVAVGEEWWQFSSPSRLCIVSAPFPRHCKTPVADTMALSFPWASSGSCHQACQEIAVDTKGRAPRPGAGKAEDCGVEFVKF